MPFDTERFIKEVEARPFLWDNRVPDYGRKAFKYRGWKSLCDVFVPNYPAMDSAAKNREVIGLQRKWKSLRDSFNRELKARRLDAGGPQDPARRPCLLFEQLSFLRPVLEAKMRDHPEESAGDSTEQEVPERGSPPSKRARSCGPVIQPSTRPQVVGANGTKSNDSDVNFFNSMLPYFQRLTPTHKVNCKLAFMAMIKKYSRRKVTPPVVSEEGGSSRTTPAVFNGTTPPSIEARDRGGVKQQQQQQAQAQKDQDDLDEELEEEQGEEEEEPEDYTSDTSPGLSAGYTDESPDTED